MTDNCKTKYPIILVHGVGFRDLKVPLYWGRIPKILKEHGADIYYGMQDSWGSVSSNAEVLMERITQVLLKTGAEKVNLIGHSKGGLEARMAASSLGMGDKIASITTIATPHHGLKTIDKLLKAPKSLYSIVAFAVNNWMRVVGDKKPDFLTVCREISSLYMKKFNVENPDYKGIFYQSYCCVTSSPWSDINFVAANFIINLIDGPNDGVVSLRSASWGERNIILKCASRRGISHLDEIDFRRAPFTKKTKDGCVSDITDVYINIVRDLKNRGY